MFKLFVRFLLFPFAILYDLVTIWRNKLYNTGIKKSIAFDLPIVNVGNLTVGGTGKTPHVALLASIFSNIYNKNVAILSRGYGRDSKGYYLANKNSNSRILGDEPLQLYQTFNGQIPVAVCEKRIIGIPLLLQDYPKTDLILLDDAYQHRKVQPHLNVLLCDYNRPFYKDFVLPAGRLRESRKGANRADVVIVTKVPINISAIEMKQIESTIALYAKAPVFYSRYNYEEPRRFAGLSVSKITQIILVTGIANTQYLLEHIHQEFDLIKHFKLADHAKFSKGDVQSFLEYYEEVKHKHIVVLTTEKDMVKLKELIPQSTQIPFYFLPITCKLIAKETEFIEGLASYIS